MESSARTSPCSIGLALSGGGVRAAAFHAGVLKTLAEQCMLEQVTHVSTVSGGSLFTGLVLHHADYQWPTSKQYLESVFPKVLKTLTTTSLQCNALFRLLKPRNWRYLLKRAHVVAQSIELAWNVSGTLEQLPYKPIWSINATTAETGHRFRFKNRTMGEYSIGYADANKVKLAEAMAISAAFPTFVGPLEIRPSQHEWRKRENWNSIKPAQVTTPSFAHLHLYDGGMYDNLGLEPLFDVGSQAIKPQEGCEVNFVIVSDAGAPSVPQPIPGPFSWRRLRRIADIGFDQARALRIRSFVNYLLHRGGRGLYVQIGTKMSESVPPSAKLSQFLKTCLPQEEVKRAACFETTLRRLSKDEFDLLARHGAETIVWSQHQREEAAILGDSA